MKVIEKITNTFKKSRDPALVLIHQKAINCDSPCTHLLQITSYNIRKIYIHFGVFQATFLHKKHKNKNFNQYFLNSYNKRSCFSQIYKNFGKLFDFFGNFFQPNIMTIHPSKYMSPKMFKNIIQVFNKKEFLINTTENFEKDSTITYNVKLEDNKRIQ